MAFADEMLGIAPATAAALGGQYTGTVTAAGNAIGNAAPIMASMARVDGADGTKGVILPQAIPGDECWVFNNSGSTLKVYPGNASTAICVPGTGLGSGGTAYSQLTYKTSLYKLITTTQWLVLTTA